MKLIIDIPVKVHENAQNSLLCGAAVLVDAVKNGIPLDKIRDEIEEERVHDDWDFGQERYYNNAIDDVLQIIDKYR